MEHNIYNIALTDIEGNNFKFSSYAEKIVLVVNTASKCGFTPQYEGLQKLYEKYKDKKFEILGFPSNQFMEQEPGNEEEIKSFCNLNYGVTFPLFKKIDVNGENAHPLFKYLKKESIGILGEDIKWNFTKFIVDATGRVVKRFAPSTSIDKIEKYLLNNFKELKGK